MKKILVIGATSGIAEAVAKIWAEQKNKFYLVARNAERLHTLSADLKIRGAATVECQTLDLNAFDQHQNLVDMAAASLGGIDIVLIAHGTLGDQKACEKDFALTLQEWNTNAISYFSLLTHLSNRLEAQKHGTIAVITSVAGDRGRRSNYVYGATKGAVSLFAQGVRSRLLASGVKVLTIKPGPVDTKMMAHMKKSALLASPDKVARDIVKAVNRGKDVIYTPGYWRVIMGIIKMMPERLFKKSKF